MIETDIQKIVPKNDHAVAIDQKFRDEDAVQSLNDVKTLDDGTFETKPSIYTV